MSSSYTVEDGKIIDDSVSNDTGVLIPFSGTKPTSGYLNYSNNTLTDGCLVFGDYAVTFDGNTASTVKGTCSSGVKVWNQYGYLDSNADLSIDTTFSDQWEVWMPRNTETGEQEICHVLNDTTICIELGHTNDMSCNNDVCTVSGYLATLKTKYESEEAECAIDESSGYPKLLCTIDGWGSMFYTSVEYSQEKIVEQIEIDKNDGSSCYIMSLDDMNNNFYCSH